MSCYTIVDHRKIEEHITFLRIEPIDISLTLREVLRSLSDLSWLSQFDKQYIQDSFRVRAEGSIKYITENIIKEADDDVTSDSGEYLVSELARKAVVDLLKYLDIPLAELIKTKNVINHGFDFYSKNLNTIILFGEAKYKAKQNAYGSCFEQIARFESEKRDSADILEVDKFYCEESKQNFASGKKGFIGAFASKKITTDELIANIQKNENYKIIKKFNELICVAVNI